jgi:hypothetical protein
VRQALFIEFSGYSNAMHGFWIALAGVPFADWLRPSWYPLADAGMPLEYTYAPLVPWLMRIVAILGGVTTSHAFHVAAMAVFCAGPATLFWCAWRLSGCIAYSFAAAALYSLSAPTELITPDVSFAWAHFGDARRMYLAFVWDEVPHLAALAFFPLALLAWVRLSERRRMCDWILAVLTMAATVLANPFGGTLLALALACYIAARRQSWGRIVVAALLAYVLISPWLPPSLLQTIRTNTNLYPEGEWTSNSWKALAIASIAWLAAAFVLRRLRTDWFTHFWLLLAILLIAIIVPHKYFDWHFMPQSGRYRVTAEPVLCMAAVFGLRILLQRLPRYVPVALALVLMPVAVKQVIAHRRYAKEIVRAAPREQMADFRLARLLQQLPDRTRAFVPGSIAMWLNAFAPVHQMLGGSFPTAVNPVHQLAMHSIYGRDLHSSGEIEIQWLEAFGVSHFVVAGPASGEFWQPFSDPARFEPKLPVVARDTGTAIYRTRITSLAHVIAAGDLVPNAPQNGADTGGIARYTNAALRAPAKFTWTSASTAVVDAPVKTGDVVSVQVNHHRGWRARQNGVPVDVRRDGLGLMVIEPRAPGRSTFTLEYTGGFEALATRAASAGVLLVPGIAFLRRRLRSGVV